MYGKGSGRGMLESAAAPTLAQLGWVPPLLLMLWYVSCLLLTVGLPAQTTLVFARKRNVCLSFLLGTHEARRISEVLSSATFKPGGLFTCGPSEKKRCASGLAFLIALVLVYGLFFCVVRPSLSILYRYNV